MHQVYTHYDRFMVFQVKQRLEDQGIPCFVKNEFAIGAMGELSAIDVFPEVWLYEDEWLSKANTLIAEFEAQPTSEIQWHCPKCQEPNEANFGVCWQCGTNRPE